MFISHGDTEKHRGLVLYIIFDSVNSESLWPKAEGI